MISRQTLAEIAELVGGIPVLGCRPGSPAAEAGIGYGDIVVAINGMPTPTLEDYLRARRLRSDGFDVTLFRDGEQRTVFVAFVAPTDPMGALALQLAQASCAAPASTPTN